MTTNDRDIETCEGRESGKRGDRVFTPDWCAAVLAKRPRKANEVAVADIVPILRKQRGVVGNTVDMIGSGLYADALSRAGFTVNRLETRGYGYMRGALRAHLLSA